MADYPTLQVELDTESTIFRRTAHLNWADISTSVRSVDVQRGRQSQLQQFSAGSATVVVDNRGDRFSKWVDSSGDYSTTYSTAYTNDVTKFGELINPGDYVRISAVWEGTTYPIFIGYAESYEYSHPGKNDAITTIRFADGYKYLNLKKTGIDLTFGERSDERVTRVLDDIGWNSVDRRLDPGLTFLGIETTDPGGALQVMRVAEESEQGYLFITPDNKLRFDNRIHHIEDNENDTIYNSPTVTYNSTRHEYGGQNTVVYTDTGVPSTAPYSEYLHAFDDENIWNEVRMTNQASTPPTTGVAESSTSKGTYGPRTLARTGSFRSSNQPDTLASFLLDRYEAPRDRITNITFPPTSAVWDQVLPFELQDRVSVKRHVPGGSTFQTTGLIETISHRIQSSPKDWRVTFSLSPALSTGDFIKVGDTIGTTGTTAVLTP